MDDLQESIRNKLIDFRHTKYFDAYMEYVTLRAGQVFGTLRSHTLSHEEDLYYKGVLKGLEMFLFDLFNEDIKLGNIKKASADNKKYTKKILDISKDSRYSSDEQSKS